MGSFPFEWDFLLGDGLFRCNTDNRCYHHKNAFLQEIRMQKQPGACIVMKIIRWNRLGKT